MERLPRAFQLLKGGLIVSCQSGRDDPFFGSMFMVEFARCALAGGAVGIRANGPEDIKAIARDIPLPLIGLHKIDLTGFQVRITPTLEASVQVAEAGAHIIALDATRREHPQVPSVRELIQAVTAKTRLPVLADISTFEEGLAAQDAGATAVSTTLSGYTDYSPHNEEPDFDLVEKLSQQLSIPVFAEGRIANGEQARRMLELGAFAVVIGSAITRPQWIVERIVRDMKS